MSQESNEDFVAATLTCSTQMKQCDQMARLLVQYLATYNNKIFPNIIKIAKIGSKFCQRLRKSFKNYSRLLKYCQSGEILPNLVTLIGRFVHTRLCVNAKE